MATEIPNLVKRNGIYYFRCRIPSTLTNGRAREVKISLKTGNLTSDLFEVIVKVSDYSRWVIAESLKTQGLHGNLWVNQCEIHQNPPSVKRQSGITAPLRVAFIPFVV